MATTNKNITAGIYTTETDLTTYSSSSSIGVTTLGLVGETLKGPAFQPIFVSDYDETFSKYFGGLSPEKFIGTNRPKYELSYIAKEYLKQSNQLYITRILGLSGYDAGPAWGIAIEANIDPTTTGVTNTNVSFSLTFNQDAITANDSYVNGFFQNGFIDELSTLYQYTTGSSLSIDNTFMKVGSVFNGINLTVTVDTNTNGTGTASGTYNSFSGTSYTQYDGNIIALIRSSAKYDSNENLSFSIEDFNTGLTMVPSSDLFKNPYGSFILSGTSKYLGDFSYNVSLDSSKKNYIEKTIGTTNKPTKLALFLEELYTNTYSRLISEGYVYGIKTTLVNFGTNFKNYKESYQSPVSPYIVSEVRGSNIFKLFRFISISDGDSANTEIKVSITNIDPNTKTFNVLVRKYSDTDSNPVVLESFKKCSFDHTDDTTYIAAKIGTADGNFVSKSNYIYVEIADNADDGDLDDAFPAGFLGYPTHDYQLGGSQYEGVDIFYKTSYTDTLKKAKQYLGISNVTGYDDDFFYYKGIPLNGTDSWTGLTDGFHMDSGITYATLDGDIQTLTSGTTFSPIHKFQYGTAEFREADALIGTDYETSESRKFTLAFYGGFDGWDIHRTSRTNTDTYQFNGKKGKLGLTAGNFSAYSMPDGSDAYTSDYYAYLLGIQTFDNKRSTPINIFATPGIDAFDNSNLIQETIDMIEGGERQDCSYCFTIPDTDYDGNIYSEQDVVDMIDGQFDSNYATSYWPWNQYNDTENNQYIWLPPTYDFCRNVAQTGNQSYLWFAVAGVSRGTINAIQTRKKLKTSESDILYGGRINPIVYFPSQGPLIWGNKDMQIADTALNRLNIRMLLNQTKSLVDAAILKLVFDPNDDEARTQFTNIITPILNNIKKQRGFYDYRIKIQDSDEIRDNLELPATFWIKPTRNLEYILIDFTITNSGIDFTAL